jgi:hypothetical protein
MSALPVTAQALIITAAFMLQLAAIAACLFYAARLNDLFAPKRKSVKL